MKNTSLMVVFCFYLMEVISHDKCAISTKTALCNIRVKNKRLGMHRMFGNLNYSVENSEKTLSTKQ